MSDNDVRVTSADAEKDPAEIARIEAEIDQTRDRITGDLRTLGERLSPENLKAEAKEVMAEAKNVAVETLHEAKDVATNTFREVKNDALETVSEKVDEFRQGVRHAEREAFGFVRENAVPLALIGAGVAWFLSNQRSRESRWEGSYEPRGSGRWRYPERSSGYGRDDSRYGLSRARDDARDYASHGYERARGWADSAEHRASELAGQARGFAEREIEGARGLARDAGHRIGDAATRARDTAGRELHRARELTRQTTETHPLAIGAAAVAAGVVVGLLIPETRRESEWLAPQRERLTSGARQVVNEAKEVVTGTKEAARDVAQTAKQTAKDAAREVKNSLSGTTG